jgi:hypothetical protein
VEVSRCKVCHEPVEDDGYGEPVHAESNRYWHGDTPLRGDTIDKYGHVAV